MPPLFALAAAGAGTALLVRFVRREWRRINDELEREEKAAAPDSEPNRPTLRKDPVTGEWRAR